jgi:hypothetical protein
MSDLPRVTEVLSPYVDFSRIAPDVLEAASDRGVRVHNCCAAYAKRIYVGPVDADCNGYVESFLVWFNKYVATVLAVEFELVSPFGYVGHADLIVRLKDGRVAVVDLKTPLAGSKTWKAQIAAYKRAATEFSPDVAGTLQLHPEGKAPKMTWLEDEVMAFNAFLSALNAQRYFGK